MKQIPVTAGKVAIANSSARVILQTFSDESLVKLKEAFPRRIPTCFLLWLGNDVSDLKQNTPEQYAAKINFGIENGAVIMLPHNVKYSLTPSPRSFPCPDASLRKTCRQSK